MQPPGAQVSRIFGLVPSYLPGLAGLGERTGRSRFLAVLGMTIRCARNDNPLCSE
jgi:hypothetical protein